MFVSRRGFLAASAGLAMAGPQPAIAVEDRALFWRIGTKTGRRAIVFGVADIAATAARELVTDGMRFVPVTHRLAIGAAGPPPPIRGLSPALAALDPAVAVRARAALEAAGAGAAAEAMSALEIVVALLGEGAAKAYPSVAEVLRDQAQQVSRPVAEMLPAEDLASLRDQADLGRLDAAAREGLGGLLALRDAHGPLGGRSQAVYRRRSSAEMQACARALDVLGGVDAAALVPAEALKNALWRRLPEVLEADYDVFVFLPVETLLGPDGILARLAGEGAGVTVLA